MNNIEMILDNFFKDSRIKSILIDGPWGCGKTTIAKEFIIQYNKKCNNNIYYVSLFGCKNIDEINTKLYYQNNKNKTIQMTGNVISKAIDIIPLNGSNIAKNIEYALGEIKKNYKFKGKIVIFDDIERASSIGYEDMMGYFNSLILQGCKLICIVSSDNIENGVLNEFELFKEKVFDRLYRINNVDNDIYEAVFKDYDTSELRNKFLLFFNNIRLAIKTKYLFLQILEYIKKSDTLIREDDKNIIFLGCIYAIIVVFGKSILDKCNIDINDNYSYAIESIFNKYDNQRKSNRDKMIHISIFEKDMNINGFFGLLTSILNILLYEDYRNFESFFNVKFNNNSILNKEFYFLSDSNKIEYYNKFLNTIDDESIKWSDELQKNFVDIYRYSNLDISDQLIKKIVKKIINTNLLENNDKNYINHFMEYIYMLEKTQYRNYDEFKKRVIKIYDEQIDDKDKKNFNELLQNNDYVALGAFITLRIKENACTDMNYWLNKLLIDNHFYLPDLSNDISYSEWQYCHIISEYVKKSGLQHEFLFLLYNLIINNIDNISMKDRILTLASVVHNNKVNAESDLYNLVSS